MKLILTTEYNRMYSKLSSSSQRNVDHALELFSENPYDPNLNNHPLREEYAGCSSIDAETDIRIVFRTKSPKVYEIVTLLKVGTHKELYG